MAGESYMKLLEAIEENRKFSVVRCPLGLLLVAMPSDESADLAMVLEDRRYEGTEISVGLHKIGHQISANAVYRHRNHRCACAQ